MIVPGSHKSNVVHPLAGDYSRVATGSTNSPTRVPMYCSAGDALMFIDSVPACTVAARGPTRERRVIILRYGPPWATPRFGYRLSSEFLSRLNPERRRIMQPIAPIEPGSTEIPLDLHSTHRSDD